MKVDDTDRQKDLEWAINLTPEQMIALKEENLYLQKIIDMQNEDAEAQTGL